MIIERSHPSRRLGETKRDKCRHVQIFLMLRCVGARIYPCAQIATISSKKLAMVPITTACSGSLAYEHTYHHMHINCCHKADVKVASASVRAELDGKYASGAMP